MSKPMDHDLIAGYPHEALGADAELGQAAGGNHRQPGLPTGYIVFRPGEIMKSVNIWYPEPVVLSSNRAWKMSEIA